MPLSVDMQLNQLKEYYGSSIEPLDIKEFWNKAKEELLSLNLDIKMVKNSFETPYCECFDLYFTGVEKANIHVK